MTLTTKNLAIATWLSVFASFIMMQAEAPVRNGFGTGLWILGVISQLIIGISWLATKSRRRLQVIAGSAHRADPDSKFRETGRSRETP